MAYSSWTGLPVTHMEMGSPGQVLDIPGPVHMKDILAGVQCTANGRGDSDMEKRMNRDLISMVKKIVLATLVVASVAAIPSVRGSLGGVAHGADIRRFSVDSAVSFAKRRSPYVRMAQAKKEQARIMWDQAGQAKKQAEAAFGGMPIPYEVIAGTFQARTGFSIASKGLDTAKAGVGFAAEASYYGVLKAEGMAKVAEEAVLRGKDQVNLAKQMESAGLVAPKDVLDAEVRLAELEAGLASAKKYQELARLNFLKTLGLGLDESFELSDKEIPYESFSIRDEALEKKIEEAMKKRFETYSAERTLDLKEIERDLLDGHNFMEETKNSMKPYLKAAQDEAVSEAEANLSAQRAEVEYSIREAFLSIKEAGERVALAERALEQAREGHRLAKLRYSTGLATSLEVMGAELGLVQAENARLNAIYDHTLAKAKFNVLCEEGMGAATSAMGAGSSSFSGGAMN
jgi:hypothetical protein